MKLRNRSLPEAEEYGVYISLHSAIEELSRDKCFDKETSHSMKHPLLGVGGNYNIKLSLSHTALNSSFLKQVSFARHHRIVLVLFTDL